MNRKKTAAKNAVITGLFCLLIFSFPSPVNAQVSPSITNQETRLRSLDELFPGLPDEQKSGIFSENGFIHSLDKNKPLTLIPADGSGIDLHTRILRTKPSYLAESLLVIPYSGRVWTKLDAYNALGKVSDLKGRLYNSHTRNAAVPLFEDATRLASSRINNTTSDPPPAAVLPSSETVYIRLKDVNFGNTYYQGDVTTGQHGLTYNLTNYKNITYLIFTVMSEGKFSAILYLEPLAEGMLVYSVAGTDTSNFIASKIDIPSAISKRLAVFIGWVSDGITGTN